MENELVREYKAFKVEYEKDFINDSVQSYQLKEAVSRLSQSDQTILVMYAEFGSLRKVGAALGVSYVAIKKTLDRIKKQVRYELRDCKGVGQFDTGCCLHCGRKWFHSLVEGLGGIVVKG